MAEKVEETPWEQRGELFTPTSIFTIAQVRSPEPTKMEGSQLKNHSSLALIFGFFFGGGSNKMCKSSYQTMTLDGHLVLQSAQRNL